MPRMVFSYRSSTCNAAKKIIKKYKRNYRIAGDNTTLMIWLSYLKFLEMLGKDLREYSVNNQIKRYNHQQILRLYTEKSSQYKARS